MYWVYFYAFEMIICYNTKSNHRIPNQPVEA